jgi:hypothetical protein
MPGDNETERLRAAIWAVIDLFEGAIANFESRGKGGQHVPYTGDFANMPPSAVSQMQRWARDLRSALKGRWPMTRKEFKDMYGTDEASLDTMFQNRIP